jgi:hypothetical protein
VDRRYEELLERGVNALERLAEDPVIQIETGPPVCPFCDTMNPSVRVEESSSSGPLVEFVIQAHCLHCNQVFYAVPYQWVCTKTTEEAGEAIQEKVKLGGYEGQNSGETAGQNAVRAGGM